MEYCHLCREKEAVTSDGVCSNCAMEHPLLKSSIKTTDEVLLYQELIMAVTTKFPNETRHQTALRYIVTAENRKSKCQRQVKAS